MCLLQANKGSRYRGAFCFYESYLSLVSEYGSEDGEDDVRRVSRQGRHFRERWQNSFNRWGGKGNEIRWTWGCSHHRLQCGNGCSQFFSRPLATQAAWINQSQ